MTSEVTRISHKCRWTILSSGHIIKSVKAAWLQNLQIREQRLLKHFLPLPVVIVGLFLLFGGLSYWVLVTGFPYVRPDRDTASDYAFHSHIASVIFWFGIGIVLFGSTAKTGIRADAPRKSPLSRARSVTATVLSAITVLCSVWTFLAYASETWLHLTTFCPPFNRGILFFTLPPAVVCTAVANLLVGPRKCKLAWISLCFFAVPVFEICPQFFAGIWARIFIR